MYRRFLGFAGKLRCVVSFYGEFMAMSGFVGMVSCVEFRYGCARRGN